MSDDTRLADLFVKCTGTSSTAPQLAKQGRTRFGRLQQLKAEHSHNQQGAGQAQASHVQQGIGQSDQGTGQIHHCTGPQPSTSNCSTQWSQAAVRPGQLDGHTSANVEWTAVANMGGQAHAKGGMQGAKQQPAHSTDAEQSRGAGCDFALMTTSKQSCRIASASCYQGAGCRLCSSMCVKV